MPWLGLIPHHWEVCRNGRLFAQRNETGHGDLPILEVSLKTGVRVRNMDNLKRKQVMSDKDKYKRAAQGDIAYNMMRMWQGAAGIAPVDGLVSPAYVVIKPCSQVDPRYFVYLFRTVTYMNEVDGYSRGIVKDRNRLYWEDFKRMPSPCPPFAEQYKISCFLDSTNNNVRRFIRNKKKLIELLKEQKQNIINKAVTRGINPDINLKPSGVQWLGDIPEHWPVMKLKRLVSMKSGDSITSLSIDECGDYPVYGGNGQRGFNSSYTHDGDFILVGRQGALCGNVHLVNGRFWASEHAIVTTLNGDDDIRWLSGLLRVMNLNQYSESAAQPGISVEKIINLQIPVPPLNEQSEIAAYFSNESKNIDVAISKTMREIELMREYRTRLISDVVTGKVDVRHIELAPVPEEELLAIDDDVESIDDAEHDDIPETEE